MLQNVKSSRNGVFWALLMIFSHHTWVCGGVCGQHSRSKRWSKLLVSVTHGRTRPSWVENPKKNQNHRALMQLHWVLLNQSLNQAFVFVNLFTFLFVFVFVYLFNSICIYMCICKLFEIVDHPISARQCRAVVALAAAFTRRIWNDQWALATSMCRTGWLCIFICICISYFVQDHWNIALKAASECGVESV